MNPRLQIKRDHRPDGKRNCPSCGGSVSDEDVLCVQCGYNKETGQRVITRKKNKVLLPALAVNVALMVAMVFVWMIASNKKSTEAYAATNVPVLAETPSSNTTEVTLSPLPDASTMAVQQKKILSQELDKKYPLYESGEEAGLRLNNGLIKRGTFIVSDGVNVRMKLPTGEKIEVPLTSLDNVSRIRSDRTLRQQFIEAQVKARIQQTAAP